MVTYQLFSSAAFRDGVRSPILERLQSSSFDNQSSLTARSDEYFDKCGGRRRSSSGICYGANFGSREHVYEPFDKIIDEINATVDGLNFDSIQDEIPERPESVDPEQVLDK